jgi:hypothetical protein
MLILSYQEIRIATSQFSDANRIIFLKSNQKFWSIKIWPLLIEARNLLSALLGRLWKMRHPVNQRHNKEKSNMRALKGLILAGGLLVAMAGDSSAQVAVSIGNPYGGGLYVGAPAYGYGYGYGGLGYPGYYNSGYLGRPGTFAYSSGYRGYAPLAPGYGAVGYGYGPSYGVYRYGGYRAGGFAPFRGIGRRFR